MKLLLKLRYDGSCFFGCQVQPSQRTVQGELNIASEKLFSTKCNITGCSRTDSGVHADAFYASVETVGCATPSIPTEGIVRAYNSFLPSDICVCEAKYVADTFHPRYDVLNKEYTYKFYESEIHDPFLRNYMLRIDKAYSDEQVKLVCDACTHLLGEHDFAAFMSSGSNVKSTVRKIEYAYLKRTTPNTLEFKICADGFLYNMVRIIVGTMMDVAQKKIDPDDIKKIIESKDRRYASKTAPSMGLYLSCVRYPDKLL